MAEQIFTMSNTRIYISDEPVNAKLEVEPSDFDGINWVEIGGLYNVGELGGDQTINEFELINSDWVVKSKGTRNGGTMTNVFIPMHLDAGQSKFREAINDKCGVYAFRVMRGADCAPSANVTISLADPGVVTWEGHGLTNGQPVVFNEDGGGTLPSEIVAGTVYYVVDADADEFSVATTPGGTGVETTAASSGTVGASAPPAGMTDLFQGLATDGTRSGGAKNDEYTRTYNIAVTGRIITV